MSLQSGDELQSEGKEKDEEHSGLQHISTMHTKAETTEQPASPLVLDWDGPDDPANPHNWSTILRLYHSILPGVFGFVVTFGTSVYTPGVASVRAQFGVSNTAALVPLTVYTLGLGFGPVIGAPQSEKYGRKIIYLVTLPIYMLFTLGAGFSNTFASLIVCRFFAGITGASSLAVGAGSNADLWEPHKRALVASCYLTSPFLGPAFGPLVGGFAAQYKGWRWTQWCIEFISVFMFILAIFTRETYKPTILPRHAKKRGITVPPMPKPPLKANLKRLASPLVMLTTEPVVFFFSLYTAFAFAVLFAFFAAFPYVFLRPPYNFSISEAGLCFLGIAIGVLIAGLTCVLADRKLYQPQYRKALQAGATNAAPEHRLYSAMIGSLGIPIGLFWFAWTADRGVHWIVPIIATIPFAWGNMCLFTSAALYMIDTYGPMYAGSAIAGNGMLRYTLGGVFPLFTVQMYSKLGIGWATSLLGFLSLGMLPIPWLFFKFGPGIRKKSRFPVII